MRDSAEAIKARNFYKRRRKINLAQALLWASKRWIFVFLLLFGIYWGGAFLAPVFMQLGWTGAANAIYGVYSLMCHQMAQRSLFLFGPQTMYNVAQLPVSLSGGPEADMLALRTFIGNPELGWKVAWSDRMVYMYGGVLLAGVWYIMRRKRSQVQPMRWIAAGLWLLPMIVDGGTHLISDAAGGLWGGFRYENAWLADLTGNAFPTWFYVGDAFGSFNSWMRLVSGLLFGLAVVGVAFPHLDRLMRETAQELQIKLAKTA